MKDIAQNIGFEIVYGDTDSLFLNYVNSGSAELEALSKFKEECNRQLGVDAEHAKTYQTAIISDKKKHYIGWTGIEGGDSDIVGMEGEKNDRPSRAVAGITSCTSLVSGANQVASKYNEEGGEL
jgi:DNA polymerase elongation subunit (family B)